MKKLTAPLLAICFMLISLGVQAQSRSKLEKDLEELRTWMNRKSSQADSLTRAEWPMIKKEFKLKTEDLERETNQLSDSSKKEYSNLKSRYSQWEQKNEERYGEPLNREVAAQWERELAGTNNFKQLKADDMRPVFTRFTENVRRERTTWSLRDWNYAEHVYLQLSNRKQEVLPNMHSGDKIKVAALQLEFNTLRKGRDAKDMYQNMRENR